MKLAYRDNLDGLSADQLRGFFVGWPDPPSPETHLCLLTGSYRSILAVDEVTGQVIGFVTAISDGVLSAYIPLLEVLPDYQSQGVGQELMRRILSDLGHLYMVDLLCDPELQPYYESLGMMPGSGMMIRQYERQSGA